METGQQDITWFFTAPHRTSYFRYYITRTGWDPNSPLTYDSFEYLGTFDYWPGPLWEAPRPSMAGVTHTVNIPSDRTGYHVIFAEWNIADSGASFFRVKDVYISGDGIYPPTPPPTPTPTPTPTPPPAPPCCIPEFINVPGTVYTQGDIWYFNGQFFEVKLTFVFWGDPSWKPSADTTLWRLL